MKSPFPGMDPYLEHHWGDIHTRLMTYICDEINRQLPGDLVAQAEEEVKIDLDGSTRLTRPDVAIMGTSALKREVNVGVEFPDPIIVKFAEEKLRWLEIIDLSSGNKVITVIDVLSPTNKSSGRAEYISKRRDYIRARTNLVEIDLLRAGIRVFSGSIVKLAPGDHALYYVSNFRGATPDGQEIYLMPLRKPLPSIPIPLRPEDLDVALPLQKMIDFAYERGRYNVKLDYTKPLSPELNAEDAAWAEELIASSR